MRRRRFISRLFDTVPVLLTSLATVLLWVPWYRTGSTQRSAFRLASALRAAGLLTRTPAVIFVVAIALVPGLAATACFLWAIGFRRAGALAVTAVGALTAGCAIGVQRIGGAGVTQNVTIEAVIGLATVVGALVHLHVAPADRRGTP